MSRESKRFASVLDATLEAIEKDKTVIDKLCKAHTLEEQLRLFLAMTNIDVSLSKNQLLLEIDRCIASIDVILNQSVNAVIHHSKFQKLEASCRGLFYFLESIDDVV